MRTLLAFIAAALFTAASANEPSADKERSKQTTAAQFDALDRNDDGRVSKSEARTEDTLSAQFAAVDADSDGYVSESEYTAAAIQPSRSDRPSPEPYNRPMPDPY